MKKVLFSLIMVLAAVPVFAVEFESGEFKANIYGEIYGDAFYTYSESYGQSSNSFGSEAFVGSSLLGVELTYGNVTGTFEAGLADPVQRFFLTYRFNGAEDHFIVVGRDTTIAAYSFGQVSQDLGSLNDLGTLADNDRLQIRYGIKGFELAEFKVFGAYGAYMYSDNSNAVSDKVFHSYNIGFGGQADFGNSFLQFTGWYGANLDLMDALGNYKSRVVAADPVNVNKISMFLEDGTKSENIQSAGVAIGLGHTFNEKYTPQIGVGYTLNFGDGYAKMDDSLGAYLNCVIQINDWFAITPEIAYINKMQDSAGEKEGYDFIAGAMASVVF